MAPSCYCGCATQQNQELWILFNLIMGMGFVCHTISFALTAQCEDDPDIKRCKAVAFDEPDCEQQLHDLALCFKKVGIAAGMLENAAFGAIVAACIPLLFMCFCSSPPARVGDGTTVTVAEVAQEPEDASPLPQHADRLAEPLLPEM